MACGGASDSDQVSAPATAVEAAPETAAPEAAASETEAPADASATVVPPLLQFTAPLVGGGELVGDELAGKPTAFWFWSPT